MASDDYGLAVLFRDQSFGKAQSILYFGWTDWFTGIFLSGLFIRSGVVARYYFLPALSLLFLTWAAVYFLLTSINNQILGTAFSSARIVQASWLFFFLSLYTMADIAAGIYWFNSAIVYQSAFILFFLLLGCLIRRFFAPFPKNILLKDSLAILLIISIVGCNEVAAIFLMLFLLTIIMLIRHYRRPVPRILFLYLAAGLFTGILITLTSGVISTRHTLMNPHTSYLSVLPIIAFRVIAVFYYILKEPLFWITAFFLFVSGMKAGGAPDMTGAWKIFRDKDILLPGMLITLLLVTGTLTPVLMVSKGSLPPRSLNNLIALTTMCLLATIFITGVRNAAVVPSLPMVKVSPTLIIIAISAGLIASTNYVEAWRSVFSGYFCHAVLEDRDRQLSTAKMNHHRAVTIGTYEETLDKKVREVFPHGIFKTVSEVLQQKPTAIYFYDDAAAPSAGYLAYYGLDTIIIAHPSLAPGGGNRADFLLKEK